MHLPIRAPRARGGAGCVAFAQVRPQMTGGPEGRSCARERTTRQQSFAYKYHYLDTSKMLKSFHDSENEFFVLPSLEKKLLVCSTGFTTKVMITI